MNNMKTGPRGDLPSVRISDPQCRRWALCGPCNVVRASGLALVLLLFCAGLPAQVPLPNGPGSALRFDGVDDFVQIPHSPALTISNRFTIEFWFKPASL